MLKKFSHYGIVAKIHVRTHMGGKSFKDWEENKEDNKMNTTIGKASIKIKMYICPKCGQRFHETKDTMLNHLRNCNSPLSNEIKVGCLCGKVFSAIQVMMQHLKTCEESIGWIKDRKKVNKLLTNKLLGQQKSETMNKTSTYTINKKNEQKPEHKSNSSSIVYLQKCLKCNIWIERKSMLHHLDHCVGDGQKTNKKVLQNNVKLKFFNPVSSTQVIPPPSKQPKVDFDTSTKQEEDVPGNIVEVSQFLLSSIKISVL